MTGGGPFPGMDPYLEQHWRDVHSRLVVYAADALQEVLPAPLRARIEERVFVESGEEGVRSIYPDVCVVEHRAPRAVVPSTAPGGVAVAAPLVLRLEDEPVTQRSVEIVDAGSGDRVVTVLEVLSPSNKAPGEGQALYLRKQRDLRAGRVSLVEVDLLRAGTRVLSVRPEQVPPSHRTPYQVVVRRGHRPEEVEVYAVPLRERLPVIAVPLREQDPDVPLDLQALVDRCYRLGRYDATIDYAAGPAPPLDPDDAAWADALLRAAGRR
ncbi:MAG: DUF4058 family protein [Planctomycetes bacterium]|nr:DUF4058 family protein [Planctomycetota bacterium]